MWCVLQNWKGWLQKSTLQKQQRKAGQKLVNRPTAAVLEHVSLCKVNLPFQSFCLFQSVLNTTTSFFSISSDVGGGGTPTSAKQVNIETGDQSKPSSCSPNFFCGTNGKLAQFQTYSSPLHSSAQRGRHKQLLSLPKRKSFVTRIVAGPMKGILVESSFSFFEFSDNSAFVWLFALQTSKTTNQGKNYL